MAEILGLGLTHYPLLSVTDEHMADLLLENGADQMQKVRSFSADRE